jgi:ABC-type multidrug transport system ATPase subunit
MKRGFRRNKYPSGRIGFDRRRTRAIFDPMSNYCLETTNLSHRWNACTPVLNAINLSVPTGSIYGFLGPNGAGKTTTLRLILGLLKKQQGEIKIFSWQWGTDRIAILSRIGSLIESPSIYPQLTAQENLRVLQRVYHCPKTRIEEVLGLTRLADTAGKKAGNFSLGMKQRLAIAIALLNDPALLILDEPTNGLDPEGIIEMRELFRDLNRRGVTILLSSHLLGEMQKIITHTGIIHKGQLLFQGTLDQLYHAHANTDLETIFITLTKKRP